MNQRDALRLARPLLYACLGAMLISTEARATPFTYTLGGSYQYGISADGQGFSSGPRTLAPVTQATLDLPNVDLSFDGRYGSFSGVQMSGSATSGTLRGSAFDSADTRGGNALLGTVGANGHVGLGLYFIDALRFDSGTLAAGTPIDYTAEYVLDSFFTSNLGVDHLCDVGAPYGEITLDNFLVLGSVQLVSSSCNPNNHQVVTSIVHSTVGADVTVSEQLRIGSDARDQPGIPYQTIEADAGHTAHLYITVNTPGVTFRSASGATYAAPADATPVPEPATLTLLGGGLLALITRRRSSGAGSNRSRSTR